MASLTQTNQAIPAAKVFDGSRFGLAAPEAIKLPSDSTREYFLLIFCYYQNGLD
jgi:hypothetical protein